MLRTVFILAALLVVNARSQEYESDETNFENNDENTDENTDENADDDNDQKNTSWLSRFFVIMKKFIRDVMGLFKEFKAVFEKKTRGVVVWTEELWAGMKKDMNDWIDDYDYATSEEKDEMRIYLERLQMPKESEEDEY